MKLKRAHRAPLGFAVAAALLAVAGTAAEPAPSTAGLGRLFFTPEERAALDRRRQSDEADAGEARVRVDGRIQRSAGRGTVWINGAPHDAAAGAAAELRAGEAWDPATQTRSDLIGEGRIVIRARRPH